MGGFFGITSKQDCLLDVFFGTDYHSHLGTSRAGMAAFDPEIGLQREIHSIENAPFRTRFEHVLELMKGTSAIGCISDGEPQPLLIHSGLGTYAICIIGAINNSDELIKLCVGGAGGHFNAMTGGKINPTELVAALINQKSSFAEGIAYAQEAIRGTASILILRDDGAIITARDRLGRIPVLIGKREDGYAVSFESFAYIKLDFADERELGPGECVCITPDGIEQLNPPREEMRICAFLWSYFGYPTSTYEGINVEEMRYRNGEIMAAHDEQVGNAPELDYVSGVPDSGTPHAIGYANRCHAPFARPYIKYTPTWSRSFMPKSHSDRRKTAKMKQIAICQLIEGKNLLFVDDSIVRGTQLQETVDFLYSHGAKSVHMRSACPPIMYGCKFLNFSRNTSDMDLITRRTIMELEGEEGFKYLDEYANGDTERGKKLRQVIAHKLGFASLEFQSLEGVIKAIGLPACKLCTYCWTGKE